MAPETSKGCNGPFNVSVHRMVKEGNMDKGWRFYWDSKGYFMDLLWRIIIVHINPHGLLFGCNKHVRISFQADCPPEGRLSHQTRAAGKAKALGKPADWGSIRELTIL